MSVRIYTDGSAKGNPGPGGYGIVLLSDEGHRKEVAKGFRKTTNNRMELLSVIIALEMLKSRPMDVVVYSDSKYVVDAVEKKWVFNWEKKYFDKKKNVDLWKRFLIVYRQHNVKFFWVKGHNNNVENERCDKLAVAAAEAKQHHDIDRGYESQHQNPSLL
ncbi:MAG TPA: ribonuclease HI [Flavobacteriales bacterium]|nr:ribonuclease HI [Flavobacteriales bacterium]